MQRDQQSRQAEATERLIQEKVRAFLGWDMNYPYKSAEEEDTILKKGELEREELLDERHQKALEQTDKFRTLH